MKTKPQDLFPATVHPILRSARDEGASATVVTDSFLRALERVYGPNALAPAELVKLGAKLVSTHGVAAEELEERIVTGFYGGRKRPRAEARALSPHDLASLKEGIAQAGRGETVYLGSFAPDKKEKAQRPLSK